MLKITRVFSKRLNCKMDHTSFHQKFDCQNFIVIDFGSEGSYKCHNTNPASPNIQPQAPRCLATQHQMTNLPHLRITQIWDSNSSCIRQNITLLLGLQMTVLLTLDADGCTRWKQFVAQDQDHSGERIMKIRPPIIVKTLYISEKKVSWPFKLGS